ncbi:MAG: PilZ domain-containing protein [Spirochaetales bacterium]|nr:PilZ domain-containing protein [Spirochaetales bacterium]
MTERRKNKRIKHRVKTIIRKQQADGSLIIMEFLTSNLSAGGVFIVTEDLSLFDISDEVSVLINEKNKQFYEGQMRVVRSARVFGPDNSLAESGYGLMFLDTVGELSELVGQFVARQNQIIL